MVRSIEKIEQDIAALQEAVKTIADELYQAYNLYLTALGQAVRQQLIFATYHICTQGYPDAFMSLSFSDRQNLQQKIRQLTKNLTEQLISQMRSASQLSDSFESFHSGNPEYVIKWQESLEELISQTLQLLSRDTNKLLQQNGILSSKFPDFLLDAAAKADASNDAMAGTPNILNLVIESENSQESQNSSLTHIKAIHLRLSEIEFADAASIAGRNQIRQLLGRLNNLRREYQKKQRDRIIAQAESAWRSSWFED